MCIRDSLKAEACGDVVGQGEFVALERRGGPIGLPAHPLLPLLPDALVGVVAGALVMAAVTLVQRLRRTA